MVMPVDVDPVRATEDRLRDIHAELVSLLGDIADGIAIECVTARLTGVTADVARLLD